MGKQMFEDYYRTEERLINEIAAFDKLNMQRADMERNMKSGMRATDIDAYFDTLSDWETAEQTIAQLHENQEKLKGEIFDFCEKFSNVDNVVIIINGRPIGLRMDVGKRTIDSFSIV